jgi:hypothetical protein
MQRSLVALFLLLLSSCTYFQDPNQIEANIVRPGNFKAGSGVIESVSVLPRANKNSGAPRDPRRRPDPNLYRLSLRMDAGGFQTVDIDDGTFMQGEAVELTNDGRIVRVSGTTLNDMVRR